MQYVPMHGRSASSSDLAGSTANPAVTARQRQFSGERRPVPAPPHRSAVGRTDMPPPLIVPSKSVPRLAMASDGGSSRAGGAPVESGSDKLFQSDSTAACGPSRPTTATGSNRRTDSRPLRPQGSSTSGPKRPAAPISQDGSQGQPSRSRTGPIRPVSSMAAIPPSRQDAPEMPHRVVGGARRVPRMPPPDPPSTTVANRGERTESKASASFKPVMPPRSVEPSGATTAKGVAPKGKQNKPVTKATEKAKPISKAASTHRVGTRAANEKRAGQAPPGSCNETGVAAAESKGNKHDTVEGDQKSDKDVRIPAEIPLPPSPPQNTVLPPSEVPLPSNPQQIQTRPTEPKVEIATGPATPDRSHSGFANVGTVAQTPISALVADIELGFLFTPGDPLSPAQGYADQAANFPVLPPLRALRTSRLSDITE
ncbi:hypothetical protein DAEQUDRAFT_53697 [Daedalea quercina L-15889]|uniref:Uncharacterized protein n=1 Tax=Daedalea quercina L-15889 TaxID=1314783 RepID=A0A165SIA4_9APHY|nr:hypothetical protein DAEQUDRAFT_53697 [Daedalea quercina L-15889]